MMAVVATTVAVTAGAMAAAAAAINRCIRESYDRRKAEDARRVPCRSHFSGEARPIPTRRNEDVILLRSEKFGAGGGAQALTGVCNREDQRQSAQGDERKQGARFPGGLGERSA